MLYHWIWTKAGEQKIYWGEAGWILEDNPAMNAGLEKMNFRVYKTYRLYDRPAMKAMVTGRHRLRREAISSTACWRAGDEVTALVRSPAQGGGPRGARRAGWCGATSTTRRRSARRCAGRSVVYHVAALVGARDEAEFLRANREGTANVVRAMEAACALRRAWCS